MIFNESLRSGLFPHKWKLAHVVPIHKDGSQHDVRNYRPISKLSIPAKIFDNILADEVSERFENIIIPNQHGFFRRRSTVTNLASYTEKLQRCVDSGGQTDVIYTDFSKAFDKVSHVKLLEKLRRAGIGGTMLRLF
jgi:Reverse transcriptase (RNA-dependent DNA polymerase)